MNNWAVTANLGRDAETRFTASGDAVVSFSVAVKSGFGERATTTWANCAMFGKRGQAVADYLKKGTLVGITGEVSLREWKDKEGQVKTSLDFRVNDLTLLGGKPEQGGKGAASHQQEKQNGFAPKSADPFDESDVPF